MTRDDEREAAMWRARGRYDLAETVERLAAERERLAARHVSITGDRQSDVAIAMVYLAIDGYTGPIHVTRSGRVTIDYAIVGDVFRIGRLWVGWVAVR